MSAPRIKRPFAGAASDPSQRQITSYFGKDANGSVVISSSATTPTPSSQSSQSLAVPAQVQANLLSVGMRVRKSVPEGYKTGSDLYGDFSLWADRDASNMSSAAPAAHGSSSSPPRELLPFCGIHKVGGLATQPGASGDVPLPAAVFDVSDASASASASAAAADDFSAAVPGIDDVPPLTSSQESVASLPDDPRPLPRISVAAPSSTNRKRFFADDEPSEAPTPFGMPHGLGVWRDRAEWLDGEVSPRSLAPAGWENARVMAVPRRRGGKKSGGPPSLPLVDMGQENMVVDDFEEAEFLDCRHAGEMEIE